MLVIEQRTPESSHLPAVAPKAVTIAEALQPETQEVVSAPTNGWKFNPGVEEIGVVHYPH